MEGARALCWLMAKAQISVNVERQLMAHEQPFIRS